MKPRQDDLGADYGGMRKMWLDGDVVWLGESFRLVVVSDIELSFYYDLDFVLDCAFSL